MPGRRLAVFLLCFGVLHTPGNAAAQDVKSTFDKSVDFTKYKKYTWGSNYLLTQQPKDVQERINMAIVDSIQRPLYASDMVGYYWGDFSGISSDVWISSLAKVKITVTDAVTKRTLWEATASKRIHDPMKFKNKLQENVDKFIQKTMKGFPPKK
jgi:hypothetical protein